MKWDAGVNIMDNVTGILMSIKPKFAQAIIRGEKTIELRKYIPRISPEDIIVFYESSPIQRVTFYCKVLEVISMSPQELWDRYSCLLGLTKEEYDVYFCNRPTAYGIRLREAHIFSSQMKISDISQELSAPQSFRYMSSEELEKVFQWHIVCKK